jgi:hypothetical protein
MRATIRLADGVLLGWIGAVDARAGSRRPAAERRPAGKLCGATESQFSSSEIVNAGHRFFGTVSRGLAQVVEKAVSQWGLPNGYVLGEEAGGAFVAGLRYGEACSTPRTPAI